MNLTEQQHQLLEFVRKKHNGQTRKYTGEPYINHPIEVAKLVSTYVPNTIEIALCHDLLEDTDCTYKELLDKLISLEYQLAKAREIVHNVMLLSDKYTKEDCPFMNRGERKRMEAVRLGRINPVAQSVKYADLIHNTASIVKHDKKFAEVYLQEKITILDYARKGDINLLVQCCYTLQKGLNELNQKEIQ